MIKKYSHTILVTLTVLLGAQIIRVMFPSVAWYLRDTVRPGIGALVGYALAPFLLAFILPLVVKALGAKNALWLSGIGLAVARLAEQISTSPAADLWLAMVGILCWLWLLPLLLGWGRDSFVHGFLIGLMADVLLKSATGTLDLSWIAGIFPILTILLLTSLFLFALQQTQAQNITPQWAGYKDSFPLISLGSLLFLAWLISYNIGWRLTIENISSRFSSFFLFSVFIFGISGIASADAFMSATNQYKRPIIIFSSLFYFVMVFFAESLGQEPFLIPFFLFDLIAISLIFNAIIPESLVENKSISSISFSMGVGQLFFVLFGLMYYLALDLPLPFEQQHIRIIAGIFLTIITIWSALIRPFTPSPPSWLASKKFSRIVPLSFSVSIIIIMTVIFLFSIRQESTPSPTATITVMTYNIHSAYSEAGRHNPQEIANNIRNANADIVGIQEISRGWLIDGSTDLFAYLQRELDMPYAIFSATADPVWGNAILSRYPIIATESAPLPLLETRIPRGYVGATIDLGHGNEILFLNTHLHHRADNLTRVHLAQLDTILTAWDRRPHTIFVGDMNAQPGWQQTDTILNLGFVDSWAEAGVGEGLTTGNRIDWVFHTPDLVATQAEVIQSPASDHFPIVVKISLR